MNANTNVGIEEYERIFERYLDICNQAIEKSKNTFPYTEIWRERWKKLGQKKHPSMRRLR